ncbi:MAG: PhzF family phenazine biosynthesis protein [Chitinophagaceae bacterium]|nr:PhzF family phenazine biosynthesis protein [Chitinophagaceae bacterium]
MKLKIYQLDAFTNKLFSGNPAAVCPLEKWLPDEKLQAIAAENNLAETAFYVKQNDQYEIRWFTPAVEVDLCGHATLASAKVLYDFENYNKKEVIFFSPRSGILKVTRNGEMYTLDFPADKYERVELSAQIIACFDSQPLEAYKGKTDLMLVFNTEEEIKKIIPDLNAMMKLKVRGIIITSPGTESDFVSRFFAPQSGVNEDPVTGSAHTTLTPYWAQKTGKSELTAIQLSARKGFLTCAHLGDRVKISGQGVTYLQGEITVE